MGSFQTFMASKLKKREEDSPGSVRSVMMGPRPTEEVQQLSQGMYKKKKIQSGPLSDYIKGLAAEEYSLRPTQTGGKTTLG